MKKFLSQVILGLAVCSLPQVSYGHESPPPEDASSSSQTDKKTASNSFIEEFGNSYLTYFGGYQNFDKGFYGIGTEHFNKSGVMTNMSLHFSYGLIDPGHIQFRLGGGYAYAPAEFVAITGRINALVGTGTKYEISNKGDLKKKDVIAYGILFAPGVRVKLSKMVIGVNFDLGWAYTGSSGFYKDVEITLGYHF